MPEEPKPNEISLQELKELACKQGVVLYDIKGAAICDMHDSVYVHVHMELGTKSEGLYSELVPIPREAHDALMLEGKLYTLNTALDKKR
ncbi:hypothetical protein KY331_05595 [Candidatus Woesearchaeota archaeon]|nr:hypothetical protein [Candidatus Woesearchaeota archaeon]